jgi:hypothetical protein
MMIIDMIVVQKQVRYFFILTLVSTIGLFFPFSVLAYQYGQGDYGTNLYSADNHSSSPPTTSSSSSSSSSSAPTGCTDERPIGKVDLFQIDRKDKTATLYFTPINDHIREYHVVFGFKEGKEQFGGIGIHVDKDTNNGVQVLKVNALNPAQTYAFKVIPVNGCALGDWSNWLTAKGKPSGSGITKYYRYTTAFVRSLLGK